MNKKTQIQSGSLGVLVLLCGFLWYHNGSTAGASEGETGPSFRAAYHPMSVENPRIHWDRLTESQETEYTTTGRDLFNWQLPPPPPPPPPVHIPGPGDEDYVAPPPPPPPPPVLPLKFFGIGTDAKGSSRRAFLTNGNEVFIVAEGETVLGHFRIIKINNVNLEFEEIGSGRRSSKQIEDQNPLT
jgi:hypothetical protein